MKKKKMIILIIIVLCVLGVSGIYIIMKHNDSNLDGKITFTFDSNGGSTVKIMKLTKGEKVTLPNTTREGYTFQGWYVKNKKQASKVTATKNTTFKAEWEKIPEDAKTFTISFDSNGGTEVSDLVVECDKEVILPEDVTREGYSFITWIDENAVPIRSGALLSCEDITLYAKWQKEDDSTNTEKKEEKQKNYTCTEGKLDGDKCIIEKEIKERCPNDTKEIDGGVCVTINNNAREDYNKSCEKVHVTYMSYAGYTEGKVVNWGITGCAYFKTNDTSKSNCESHGFKWVTPENACYVKWDTSTVIKVCNQSGYIDVPNPNNYVTNTGLNAGCYPTSVKEKYCDDGYTLTEGKCLKTIAATIK